MIFAVNLTVDTKTTDLYDKVAVNKFPVIVMKMSYGKNFLLKIQASG